MGPRNGMPQRSHHITDLRQEIFEGGVKVSLGGERGGERNRAIQRMRELSVMAGTF